MTRPVRIALNTLAPPLLATLLFIGGMGVVVVGSPSSEPGDFLKIARLVPIVLLVAFLFATIPSLIHALIMEKIYRACPPETWKAVFASSASGFFAGLLIDIAFFLTQQRTTLDGWLILYPVIGCIVGFLLGFLVKLLSGPHHPPKHSLRGCE